MFKSTEAKPVCESARNETGEYGDSCQNQIRLRICFQESQQVTRSILVYCRAMDVIENLSTQHLPLENVDPSTETAESIDDVFESILESEYRHIETMVTLSNPTAQLLPALSNEVAEVDQRQWIGIERFIRPFEITYDFDAAENINVPESMNPVNLPMTAIPTSVKPTMDPLTAAPPVAVNIPAETSTAGQQLQVPHSKATVRTKVTSKRKKATFSHVHRYDWTRLLDKQGLLYTHTCSQLITKKRSTLSLYTLQGYFNVDSLRLCFFHLFLVHLLSLWQR